MKIRFEYGRITSIKLLPNECWSIIKLIKLFFKFLWLRINYPKILKSIKLFEVEASIDEFINFIGLLTEIIKKGCGQND